MTHGCVRRCQDSPLNFSSTTRETLYTELLSDGYLSRSFGRNVAVELLNLVLGGHLHKMLHQGPLYQHPPGFFVLDNLSRHQIQPHDTTCNQPSIPSMKYLTIDYRHFWTCNQYLGPVVPQTIWGTGNGPDTRIWCKGRNAWQSPQLPIYFVRDDVSDRVGLSVKEALSGVGSGLRGWNERLAGMASSTYIRICVSLRQGVQLIFLILFFFFNQWPGYQPWQRQVQLRHETPGKEFITLERFAKHVAMKIKDFGNVSE
jgi:hypothetical protein